MPCDQIILNRVDVGTMNPELLKRALVSLGAIGIYTQASGVTTFTLAGVRATLADGKLSVPQGAEALADTLKVAYSRETVKYVAQRNGWTLTETLPNQFAVTKQ